MSNQIEFRHLRYFYELSKELHYRKAAENLYISQSGLSKQIQQLESIIGVQLLERDKKSVRLTRGGVYLKEEVAYLEGYLDRMTSRLQSIGSGLEGEIRIGFVGSAMQNVIPKLLIKSNEAFPRIHFSLDEMSNQLQIEALQKNMIDIGFVRLAKVPECIYLQKIFTENFVLVLPKDHPIEISTFKNIGQLANEPFILFSSDYSSTYYEKIMSIFKDAGFQPKISHKSIHANTIFRIVESGLGLAIVPYALTLGFQLNIKIIPLKDIPQKAELSVVWKKDNVYAALQRFLGLVEMIE